jgi:hypothetical protein
MAQEITRLTPAELLTVREKCARLPPHDWMVRLLATYDFDKLEAEALRMLLREERAEARRREATVP